MSPEQQRIAIAESMGWQKHPDVKCVWIAPAHAGRNWAMFHDLPDYLSDLNAMHEVELVLFKSQWPSYYNNLAEAYDKGCDDLQADCLSVVHSTAAQRAEAYLKTINKWTD